MNRSLDNQQKASALRAIESIRAYWKSKGKRVSVWYVKKAVRDSDGYLVHYDYEIKSDIKVTWKE